MIKPGMFISDRYEIIDKVGSGGMADVYKAKCHRLNRYVAIKILKPEYSNDKNFVTKFRGEAQSAAGLSHPNIVNVYDVGDDDGLYYIVMELVEGITLKKFIERKGKLEIKEAVGIAIQIALGMEAAHDNHIIHRDIKPQNIIISRDGKVKVTDFGIAKAATSNTVTQNAIGSVHYLSPEQARGGYSDEKSDIYSLGVTLYEMLTGKVPFAGDNTVSVALLHIQGEAVPVRELNPEVPISVDKIVQKCMQKKPERRYLSASELIKDLKKSITNPDGEYVNLASGTVNDSPTINLTDDEMNHIKSVAKTPVTFYDNSSKEQQAAKVEKEEEEELDSVDSRVEKVLVVGTIVAAVALGLAILYFVIKFFGLLDFGNTGNDVPEVSPTPAITQEAEPTPEITGEVVAELVKVPSVVGLTLEDAEKSLKAVSEFEITYTEEYSSDVEKGYVISQYPNEYSDVLPNSEIKLEISVGPESIKLPDVYNLTAEQAVSTLESYGLKVKKDYEPNNELSEGMIIRTNPARSESTDKPTMVEKGSTVTIIISSGPNEADMVAVPNLLGKTDAEAIELLKAVGLTRGNVSYAESSSYAENLICYQSTTPNQKVIAGTAIDITLSTGQPQENQPTDTPDAPSTGDENGEESGEESTETGGSQVFRYVGTVQITDNPFAEGESGEVYLELQQNGNYTAILTQNMSYNDFVNGYSVQVEGLEEGSATVVMEANGKTFSYGIELIAESVN